MAYPIITLASLASNTTPVNLTTLTGGVAGGASITGFTGADWIRSRNAGFYDIKQEGGNQLVYALFNDTGSALYYSGSGAANLASVDPLDSPGAGSPIPFDGIQFPQINSGIKFSPIADQRKRRLVMACQTYGGTFQVKASLADGSYADQTLALPSTLNTVVQSWWQCDWRGLAANSVINFEVRLLAGTGTSFAVQYAYIPVPEDAPRPRNFGTS